MRRLLLTLTLATSVGCSALLSPFPSPGQQAEVRRTAARIADAVTTAELVIDQAGALVNGLPLSVAQKDAVDCAILKVNGHDAPSPTILKVCGPVPPHAESPMGKALTGLRAVSSRPGLCATVQALENAVTPLLTRFELSGLTSSVAMLRTALGFTMTVLGGCR